MSGLVIAAIPIALGVYLGGVSLGLTVSVWDASRKGFRAWRSRRELCRISKKRYA